MKNVASSEKAFVAKTHENTTFAHSLDMDERIVFDIGNSTWILSYQGNHKRKLFPTVR